MGEDERLRVVMFSVMDFEREALESALDELPLPPLRGADAYAAPPPPPFDIKYVDAGLCNATMPLVKGAQAVSLFLTDRADGYMIDKLHEQGVRLLVERFVGDGIVDRNKARELGIQVAELPEHCVESIAEYTVTLLITLARKVLNATNRFRDGRHTLVDMLGLQLAGKTIGVIGTGRVGERVIEWLRAFDCRVLAYDVQRKPSVVQKGAEYVTINRLLTEADAVTLHVPLIPATFHLIDRKAINKCKPGVILINTARGALVDNRAVIDALHSGKIGAFGLDVLEGEAELLFDDKAAESTRNGQFHELTTMKNVLVTIHQAQSTLTATTKVATETVNALKKFVSTQSKNNS